MKQLMPNSLRMLLGAMVTIWMRPMPFEEMGREVWRLIKIPWGASKNIGPIRCPRIRNKIMLKEERRFKNLEKLRGKCWSKYDGCVTKNIELKSQKLHIYHPS